MFTGGVWCSDTSPYRKCISKGRALQRQIERRQQNNNDRFDKMKMKLSRTMESSTRKKERTMKRKYAASGSTLRLMHQSMFFLNGRLKK